MALLVGSIVISGVVVRSVFEKGGSLLTLGNRVEIKV